MQVEQHIDTLPDAPLNASAAYFTGYLDEARQMLERADVTSLVIILPQAESDHDDWRRSVARDLARQYAPKRANIIAASASALGPTLAYLKDASGVTGQYISCHE